MNRDEEKMLLQNEKAMMNKLKKDLEQEEIPLSVYPSMMKEKIKQHTEEGTTGKEKRVRNPFRKWGVALAAVLVLLVSGAVLTVGMTNNWFPFVNRKFSNETVSWGTGRDNNISNKGKEDTGDPRGQIHGENITVAESYEQLFQIFESQGQVREVAPRGNWLTDLLDGFGFNTGKSDGSAEVAVDSASGTTTSAGEMEYGKQETAEQSADALLTEEGASSDSSTTNVQEEGVDEADIIKTDGQFIYILQENENALRVVKADNGAMTECGEYALGEGSPREFYISDGILTIIMECYEDRYYDESGNIQIDAEAKTTCCLQVQRGYTVAHNLKVGEDGVLESIGTFTQDGSYQSSRKVDGIVYLFTDYATEIYEKKGNQLEEYVPRVNEEYVEADCIAIPEVLNYSIYRVFSSFRPEQPDTIIDTKAVLANQYDGVLYMSNNSIYITNSQYYWDEEVQSQEQTSRTEIIKYNYEDGVIVPQGSEFVKGTLLNSFSMNEYNGYLRLVTTTEKVDFLGYVQYSNGEIVKRSMEPFQGGYEDFQYTQVNQLYVLDDSMSVVGSIDGIAENESIRSARFMGDTGYFVTYENMDPLFSVDLSDPTNPQIMGALKIPGFSSYLHFYGDNLLLGFGQETDPENGMFLGLKLSMFDISNPYDVREIQNYIMSIETTSSGKWQNVSYSEACYNHNAMVINSNRNFIGFPIELEGNWDGYNSVWTQERMYKVFTYGEEGFTNIFSYASQCDNMRAVYIGDILYVCEWEMEDGESLTAFDMSQNFAQVGQIYLQKEYVEPDIYDYGYCETGEILK